MPTNSACAISLSVSMASLAMRPVSGEIRIVLSISENVFKARKCTPSRSAIALNAVPSRPNSSRAAIFTRYEKLRSAMLRAATISPSSGNEQAPQLVKAQQRARWPPPDAAPSSADVRKACMASTIGSSECNKVTRQVSASTKPRRAQGDRQGHHRFTAILPAQELAGRLRRERFRRRPLVPAAKQRLRPRRDKAELRRPTTAARSAGRRRTTVRARDRHQRRSVARRHRANQQQPAPRSFADGKQACAARRRCRNRTPGNGGGERLAGGGQHRPAPVDERPVGRSRGARPRRLPGSSTAAPSPPAATVSASSLRRSSAATCAATASATCATNSPCDVRSARSSPPQTTTTSTATGSSAAIRNVATRRRPTRLSRTWSRRCASIEAAFCFSCCRETCIRFPWRGVLPTMGAREEG